MKSEHGNSNTKGLRKGATRWPLLILFALTVAVPLSAAEVGLEHSVDPGTCKVGDRLSYKVRITAGPGVIIPDDRSPGIDPRSFRVESPMLDRRPRQSGGRRIWEDQYTLIPRKTGTLIIPPFSLAYTDESKKSLAATTGAPLTVEVRSITDTGEPPSNLSDIHNLIEVRKPIPNWVWFLTGGILAAAIVIFFVVRHLRRRPPKPEVVPVIPPAERALADLEELRKSSTVQDGDAEKFSVRVSDIIRVYLEGQWGIDTLDQTTEETLANISETPNASRYREDFSRFFDSCDLVKFAGDLFHWDDYFAVIDEAEDLVNETCQVPSPPASVEGNVESQPETEKGGRE